MKNLICLINYNNFETLTLVVFLYIYYVDKRCTGIFKFLLVLIYILRDQTISHKLKPKKFSKFYLYFISISNLRIFISISGDARGWNSSGCSLLVSLLEDCCLD